MTNKFRKTEKTSGDRNGIMVILAISLFIVMISGAAAIMNQEKEQPQENENQTVIENYDGEDQNLDVNGNQSVEIENNENSIVNNDVTNDTNKDESTENEETEEEKTLVFNFPCEAEVVSQYSGNTPVFSEILQDWRTHPATDFASETQFDVKAIADGVIEDIYDDGLMGMTVLIDHGNEIKSVYQSLDETISIKTGDEITAGTVIGKAGKSAVVEQYDNKYLLHFAMLENGAYKDPAEYISQ